MDDALPRFAESFLRDNTDPTLQANLRSTASQREGARRALAAIDAAKRTPDPEAAREAVFHLLGHCTVGRQLPPLIVRFLETHWRSYLTHLYIAEGEHSTGWRNAREYTEKLVRSVRPAKDKESRKRIFALLPELFQWIHTLFRSQQVAVSEEDAFFAELSKLHAVALHPHEHPTAESPCGESIELAAGAKPVESGWDTEDKYAEIAKLEDRIGRQPASSHPPRMERAGLDPLSNVRIGTWFEFINDRATKRVMRLKWVSSQKSVYLFQEHQSENTLCLTASRLDQRLRERSAYVMR